MNVAQKILGDLTSITVKTETQFNINWIDGSSSTVQGTDIINAFEKAGLPLEKMGDMQNWEYVKPKGSAIEQLGLLAGVTEDLTFEICIDQFAELDFNYINGKIPEDIAELMERGHDVSDYKPPTAQELLDSWGWQEEYKCVLITGAYCESFTHTFLKGLLHLDIPVVFDIKEEDSLPKVVRQRMFKVTNPGEEDDTE